MPPPVPVLAELPLIVLFHDAEIATTSIDATPPRVVANCTVGNADTGKTDFDANKVPADCAVLNRNFCVPVAEDRFKRTTGKSAVDYRHSRREVSRAAITECVARDYAVCNCHASGATYRPRFRCLPAYGLMCCRGANVLVDPKGGPDSLKMPSTLSLKRLLIIVTEAMTQQN